MVVVVMVVMVVMMVIVLYLQISTVAGWLNEELKIVLADRDQQDGIDWLVNYVFP